jgi:hypothetical protein
MNNNRNMDDARADVTAVFAAGSGKFEDFGRFLARSIDTQTKYDILVYIPESEVKNVSDDTLREFRKLSEEVAIEEPTIQGYGQSAKLDALAAASDRFSPPYLLLDTDTIVLSELDIEFGAADVFAKPVDFGAQYYGRKNSFSEWRQFYEFVGREMPDERIRSTVDKRRVPPYYNAGVVATTDPDFPDRWLDLTQSIFSEASTQFYSDQVALSILFSEYKGKHLTERENYPAPQRLTYLSDISVLPYHQISTLRRVRNEKHKQIFREIGLHEYLREEFDTSEIDVLLTAIKRMLLMRVIAQARHEVVEKSPKKMR